MSKLIVKNVADIDRETFADAVQALRLYFRRYSDADETAFMVVRYEFHLRRVARYGDRTFDWQIVPHGGAIERDEYDGRPKAKLYPPPRAGVIDAVPDNPSLAYRGMAWEEWQFIREKGYVESSGSHNLDQPGLTFCGQAADAESYASGFAPIAYKPAWRRPGVVIAFPRAGVLHHQDWPEKIPAGECAFRGRLSISEIAAVWYLIPDRIRYGTLEVVETRQGVRDGSRSSPSVSYVVLPHRER